MDTNPRYPIVPRVVRWSEAAEDIRAFRRLSVDGPPLLSVERASQPLMTASLAAAAVVNDDCGNTRMTKRGANNESRDDVAAAAVLASGALSRAPVRQRRAYIGSV